MKQIFRQIYISIIILSVPILLIGQVPKFKKAFKSDGNKVMYRLNNENIELKIITEFLKDYYYIGFDYNANNKLDNGDVYYLYLNNNKSFYKTMIIEKEHQYINQNLIKETFIVEKVDKNYEVIVKIPYSYLKVQDNKIAFFIGAGSNGSLKILPDEKIYNLPKFNDVSNFNFSPSFIKTKYPNTLKICNEYYYLLGNYNIYTKNDYQTGVDNLKKYIELEPNSPILDDVNNSIAWYLADYLKKYEEALPYSLKSIELNSDKSYSLHTLGYIYYHLKNYQKSIDFFSSAIVKKQKLGNKSDSASLSTYYNNRAYSYFFLNNYQQSFDDLLASFWLTQKNYSRDILTIKSLLQYEPDYKNLYKNDTIVQKVTLEVGFKLTKKENSLNSYNTFLNLFPKNLYSSFASNRVDEITAENIERDYYNNAIKGNVNECDIYISKYPNGRYFDIVTNQRQKYLDQIETDDYNNAIRGDTIACANYLSKYPIGKYFIEIKERRENIIIEEKNRIIAEKTKFLSVSSEEKEAYILAIEGKIEDCESYISKFSSGKFLSEIMVRKRKLIEDIRIQKINDPNLFYDTRDGQFYKKVSISGKTWLAENMRFPTGSWTLHGYFSGNDTTGMYSQRMREGCLYNMSTAQTVCPSGWHLPTKEDLESLIKYNSYESLIEGGYSGFNAKKIGSFFFISGSEGKYEYGAANFWSSTTYDDYQKWYLLIGKDDQIFQTYYTNVRLRVNAGSYYFSVRCVKD